MVVLPDYPKSFKLDRKSKFATQLKPLISNQLNFLCPDFTNESEDVLAEYATVLVCNGKNQNQARDDLHPFLGKKTQDFVSWLWRFLLKNETQFNSSVLSDKTAGIVHRLCDVDRDKACANRTSKKCQRKGNSDCVNMMGECDKTYSSRQSCNSFDIEQQKNHHYPLVKELTSSAIQSSVCQNKVANLDSSTKVLSSIRNYHPETVNAFEKHSRCTDLSPKAASLARKHVASKFEYLPASVAKPTCCCKLPDKDPDPAIILRRLQNSLRERSPSFKTHCSNIECPQMCNVGNALKRSLPPVVSSSNQPRKSVWDRLGKPQQDAPSRRQVDFSARDKVHCNKNWTNHNSPIMVPNPSEQMDRTSPMLPLPRVLGSRKLRQVHQSVQGGSTHQLDDTMGPKDVKTDYEDTSMNYNGRKRQFSEISSHVDTGMTTEKRAENQFEKACQSHNISEVPSDGSQPVAPQVDDMKLRLRQIELDMVKLRAKQISMEKDGKTNLQTKSGVIKPTEDESKTVLVTNVHFEATKESLSMYFWKCGAVVDVKFTDIMPSTRERSAYITFQNKLAADQALRFSGASFYSRTIKVCRKGEFRGTATTLSAEISGKKMQISPSKSNVNPEGFSNSESYSNWQNEPLSLAHSEPVPYTFDATKIVAQSTCKQGPSAASSVEMPAESVQQNLVTDTCASEESQQEHVTSLWKT